MTKRGNKTSKKKMGGRRNFPNVPSSGAVMYRGRIPINNSETGTLVTLRRAFQLTTNGSGQLSSVQINDLSAFDNYTEYSTVFQDFRILGLRYEYYPNFTVNTATVGGGLLVHSIIHSETSPTPGNITQAYSYGDARVGNVFKPWVREWKMSATDEAQFSDVASPPTTNRSLLVYIDQASASIAYGVVFVTALVQFRTTTK